MSALIYGASVRRNQRAFDADMLSGKSADAASDATDNKLLVAIVGLVPVEVIAAHGLILGFTTVTADDGSRKITDAGLLQSSLLWLVLAALLLFVTGRGGSPAWVWRDYVRAVIPPIAVLCWMSLIGTSALSPWASTYGWPPATVGVAGVVAGLLLLVASRVVADPKR